MLIGIDPGWTNLGFAVLDPADGSTILDQGTLNPSKLGIVRTVDSLKHRYSAVWEDGNVSHLTMERYVAYKGVHNPASENILMVIGALGYGFNDYVSKQTLVRAIDWKPALCKYLFKERGFRNPSKTFNKEFSMAAAEAICGTTPSSDHVADAICLAFLPKILEIKT